MTNDYGPDNSDTQFSSEPVQLTLDDKDAFKRIEQSHRGTAVLKTPLCKLAPDQNWHLSLQATP